MLKQINILHFCFLHIHYNISHHIQFIELTPTNLFEKRFCFEITILQHSVLFSERLSPNQNNFKKITDNNARDEFVHFRSAIFWTD